MHRLYAYMAAEAAHINAALDSQIDLLSPAVRDMVHHVTTGSGKRLRPLLLLLTARTIGGTDQKADLYPMACSLEFLHTATLMHDDILDGAELRRGRESAHTAFGVNTAILGGDVLLALGNRLMAGYGEPRLTDVISEAIMRTAVGEILEIHHAWDPEVTRGAYLNIITGKTAYLIQAACQCGAIGAGATQEQEQAAADFGLNLGIAFQLVDDVLDYDSTAEKAGKPVAADLLEGKLTMPLLLHIEHMDAAQKEELATMLEQRSFPENYAARLAGEVRRTGGDSQTRQMAGEYLQAAAQALETLPSCEERNLLALALDYVRTRER